MAQTLATAGLLYPRPSVICGEVIPGPRPPFVESHAAHYVRTMNLFPFGRLPAYKPRRFVPAEVDLGDWQQIAPLFDRLDAGVAQCRSVPEHERWLLDWGDLSAAIDEESTAAKPQSTTGEKP